MTTRIRFTVTEPGATVPPSWDGWLGPDSALTDRLESLLLQAAASAATANRPPSLRTMSWLLSPLKAVRGIVVLVPFRSQ